jgi:hypothetical protein
MFWSQAVTRQDDWPETCQKKPRWSPDLDDLSHRWDLNPNLASFHDARPFSSARDLSARGFVLLSTIHRRCASAKQWTAAIFGFCLSTVRAAKSMTGHIVSFASSYLFAGRFIMVLVLLTGQKQSAAAVLVFPAELWYGFVNAGVASNFDWIAAHGRG